MCVKFQVPHSNGFQKIQQKTEKGPILTLFYSVKKFGAYLLLHRLSHWHESYIKIGGKFSKVCYYLSF